MLNTKNETARFNMIEQQIRTWDVLDTQVLSLLNAIPREQFVPVAYKGLAYADIEIPLGFGQTMLSPKVEGRFLQALQLKSTDKVLQIGAGSGYLTALIAKSCQHVTAIEIEPALCQQIQHKLQQTNIFNADVLAADGHNGLALKAPYNAIVFCASSPIEPNAVREQLAINGRMLIVLGEAPVMRATLIERVSETSYKQTVLFETCLPLLVNAPQPQRFEF